MEKVLIWLINILGTYLHSCGAKYVGDWVDDKQDGFG